ncbi:HAD family phosphatase [Nonomuraea sp. NPDC046802]|uniref:HAD family hydrolase n=1 Tax=Nonomuraea sp. NPDC046802 TaxID=3154919 RepID=UPI0033E2886A
MRSERGGPEAVLLDMDGTLVDTEGLWWRATEAVAASLERLLGPSDVPHVLGRRAEDVAAHLVGDGTSCDEASRGGAASVVGRLVSAFAELIGRELTVMPGAQELLSGLSAAAVPTALVTASPRSIAELVLPRLDHAFDLVIANEDTERGKPYPDPYLEAARRLGAAPGRCVAIEDSPAGIAAATAAGCHVLVAGTGNGLPSLDRVLLPLPEWQPPRWPIQGVITPPIGKLTRRER